jgi:hypothetical protein
MFDKRFLELNFPATGRAFVESGEMRPAPLGRFDYRERAGMWVFGTARQVYRVGETPLWVEFEAMSGTVFILEHSAQFIPS